MDTYTKLGKLGFSTALASAFLVLTGCGGVSSTPTVWQKTYEQATPTAETLVSLNDGEISRVSYSDSRPLVQNYDYDGLLLDEVEYDFTLGSSSHFLETSQGLLWYSREPAQMILLDTDWNIAWQFSGAEGVEFINVYADRDHSEVVVSTHSEEGVSAISIIDNGEVQVSYDFAGAESRNLTLVASNGANVFVLASDYSYSSEGTLFIFDMDLTLLTQLEEMDIDDMVPINQGLAYISGIDLVTMDYSGEELGRIESAADLDRVELQKGSEDVYLYGYSLPNLERSGSLETATGSAVLRKYSFADGLKWSYKVTKTSLNYFGPAYEHGVSSRAVTENADGSVIFTFHEFKTSFPLIFNEVQIHAIRHHLIGPNGFNRRIVTEDSARYEGAACSNPKLCAGPGLVDPGNTVNKGVFLSEGESIISLSQRNYQDSIYPSVLSRY